MTNVNNQNYKYGSIYGSTRKYPKHHPNHKRDDHWYCKRSPTQDSLVAVHDSINQVKAYFIPPLGWLWTGRICTPLLGLTAIVFFIAAGSAHYSPPLAYGLATLSTVLTVVSGFFWVKHECTLRQRMSVNTHVHNYEQQSNEGL